MGVVNDQDTVRVRRKRVRQFSQVPHSLARDGSLGDKAFRLWIVLESYADYQERDCYPKIATLAEHCGASYSTVQRALKELIGRGLLEVESGKEAGLPSTYVLVDPGGGRSPMTDPATGEVGHQRPRGRSPMTDPGRSPMTDNKEREPIERESGTTDPLRGFEKFWQAYPRRNGTRAGKKVTRERWRKLSLTDKFAAFNGLEAYAASVGDYPKDPERYLSGRLWEDDRNPQVQLNGGGEYDPADPKWHINLEAR